ncbi:hypothetical protein Tco_0204184 [Tanacetum coccineum]
MMTSRRQLMHGSGVNMLIGICALRTAGGSTCSRVIIELQAADRRRQAVITEMLTDRSAEHEAVIEALKLLKRLQTQMTEFERQQGPAKGPAQPDAPEEAGSSS